MDLLDLHERLLAQRMRACRPGTTTNEQLLNGNLRANSALAYQCRFSTSIWTGPSPFVTNVTKSSPTPDLIWINCYLKKIGPQGFAPA
jgi:hypothetical protein